MRVEDITKAEGAPVQDAEIVVARTPEIVAAEIRQIRDDTLKEYLNSCIEIGKRLCEAKEMVAHGEWASWLKTAVSFSQRTANNLMKIYEQYGAAQGELWGASAISQTFANLSYSQAVALLAVPAEEREEFVEKNDVANMSTRELQEAIKARDEAMALLEKQDKEMDDAIKSWETEREKILKENKKITKDLDFANKKLKMEQERHDALTDKSKKDEAKHLEQIKRLEKELAEAEEKEAEPSEEMQAEIEKLKTQLKKAEQLGAERLAGDEETARFKILYETVQNNFSDLLDAMANIRDEMAKEKRKAAVKALLKRFAEVLDERDE